MRNHSRLSVALTTFTTIGAAALTGCGGGGGGSSGVSKIGGGSGNTSANTTGGSGTRVSLVVWGLDPAAAGMTFGAHVHTLVHRSGGDRDPEHAAVQ